MELTPEEKNLTAHILDMYIDTLIEICNGEPPSSKTEICIDEMVVIKSVLLKMLEEDSSVLSPNS